MENGIFICPKCNSKAPYNFQEWQKNGDKWIFSNGFKWFLNDWSQTADEPNNCWMSDEVNTELQWNKDYDNKWECYSCKYSSNTFTDFIPGYKNINQINEQNNINEQNEINEQNNINNIIINQNQMNNLNNQIELEKRINELIIKNQILEKNVTDLKNLLNIKENEINVLKSNLNNNKKEEKKYNFDDIMVIYFRSTELNINLGIKCLATDLFADVEERLNKKVNELRNTNNMYKVNDKFILRFKTLNENNIKDGDIIQIFKL